MTVESLKAHLQLLEERLLRSDVRKTPEEVDSLLADDFIEFGSSGRVFDKKQTVEGLLEETPVELTLTDFQIRVLAPAVVLATYRSCRHSDMRYALRSSLWKQTNGQWQLSFHQGTTTSS